MSKIYHVGDSAWAARFSPNHAVTRPCPVCFGDKEVKVTLGDGTEVMVDCDYCGKGFDDPTGVVSSHEMVAHAEQVHIDFVRVEETNAGTTREYQSSHYIYRELFDTVEEAETEAKRLAAEYQREQLERADCLKKNTIKSFTWNAGYHMREAKKNRAEAERHELKARICKERAKPTGEEHA